MKRWIKALGFLLAACLLVLTAGLSAFAAEESSPVLKVAFPEAAGINEVYEDGTYGGCVHDWLKEIAKYTGWEYEFVTGDPGVLMEEMVNGKYDLMGGLYLLEGLDEIYLFPKYIMGSNYSLLICRRDDPDIKVYDLSTLNGKRIGVWKKAVRKIERMQKFLSLNGVECELVYYEDEQAYESCLESMKVDLMLGSDVHIKDNYNVAAQFEADPYYLVTSKNRPELCEQLSGAMEAIYAANPNFAAELYNRYFPDRYINSISFTPDERAFLEQTGTLRVAVLEDCFPLFYQQDGVSRGIVPDCLALISQRTGLAFEYVPAETYQDLIDLVHQGKADLIGSFQNSDTFAEKEGLARTVSFASLNAVVLHNNRYPEKAQRPVMAVPGGRDLKPFDSNDVVDYYNTYQDCIDAVNSGEADYTRMPAAFIESFYARDHYPNISLVADANLQEELTLALPLPVNVPLYSVLSKALNSFSDEESLYLMSNNTLSPHAGTVTLKDLLYTNPILVIVICAGILLLLSIIVILANFNRTRARVMQLRLEKAEETSRAKSDFLSRMSHEIRTPMNAIIGLTNLTRMTGGVAPEVDKNLAQIDASAQFLLSLLNDVLDMSKIDSQKMQLNTAPFDLKRLVSQTESMFSVHANSHGLTLKAVCDTQHQFFVGDQMRLQQVLANLLSNACKFTDPGGFVRLTVEEQSAAPGAAQLRFSVRDTGIGVSRSDIELIFRPFEQVKGSDLRSPGTGLGLSISSSLIRLMDSELKVDSIPGIGSEFYFTVLLPISEEASLADDTRDEKEEADRLNGLRVLLAEDNDINAEIAIDLLSNRSVTVDWAADGQKAVELFAASPPSTYDIILMDVNMPVMDGLAATREIRGMQRPDAQTVPILAMTANTFREDRDNAARAGMTGFLPKPFDVGQLYQILCDELKKKDKRPGMQGEPL